MIKHRHPAYSDQWQPTQGGRRIQNEDTPPPSPAGDEQWEPDYEAMMERKHEKNRPDWA